MKNDIYKRNLKKFSSTTLFVITRHTYVSNMDTLSQTMARGWSYLRHLTQNLYLFIDDWPFYEEVFWYLCQNSGLSFFLATSTHKRCPCQRISPFDYFSTFYYFLEKNGQNGPVPWFVIKCPFLTHRCVLVWQTLLPKTSFKILL